MDISPEEFAVLRDALDAAQAAHKELFAELGGTAVADWKVVNDGGRALEWARSLCEKIAAR